MVVLFSLLIVFFSFRQYKFNDTSGIYRARCCYFLADMFLLLLFRQYDQWYRALRLLAAGGLPQGTDVKTARYLHT